MCIIWTRFANGKSPLRSMALRDWLASTLASSTALPDHRGIAVELASVLASQSRSARDCSDSNPVQKTTDFWTRFANGKVSNLVPKKSPNNFLDEVRGWPSFKSCPKNRPYFGRGSQIQKKSCVFLHEVREWPSFKPLTKKSPDFWDDPGARSS